MTALQAKIVNLEGIARRLLIDIDLAKTTEQEAQNLALAVHNLEEVSTWLLSNRTG